MEAQVRGRDWRHAALRPLLRAPLPAGARRALHVAPASQASVALPFEVVWEERLAATGGLYLLDLDHVDPASGRALRWSVRLPAGTDRFAFALPPSLAALAPAGPVQVRLEALAVPGLDPDDFLLDDALDARTTESADRRFLRVE